MITRRSLLGFAAGSLALGAWPRPASALELNTRAQIYLMRGLANVFSFGMDEIGERLRVNGFRPVVANWRAASTSVRTIGDTYLGGQRAPIILIGHSLGANAVMEMGHTLARRNVPVAYMVTLDATQAATVPGNVREFVNFFQRNGFGQPMNRPANFRGTMINIDLTDRQYIRHKNMDQRELIQEIIVGKIWQITACPRAC
jgi:hypothetical protein